MAGNVLADLVVRVSGDITPVVTAFGKLKSEMSALQTIGAGFTAVGAAMTAGITLPIMGVATAAVKSAITVGGAWKDISAQTGHTGAELEKLKTAFNTVFASVPQSAGEVSKVISIIHDKLGEMNYGVAETGKRFLDLARMTGEAPAKVAEGISSMLQNFKVPMAESESAINMLYTAFAETHVPITTLTSDINRQAQVLTEIYGFSLNEAIALMATFNEAQISTSDLMRGMDYGWANLQKVLGAAPPKVTTNKKTGETTTAASSAMYTAAQAVRTEIQKLGLDAKDSGDQMIAVFKGIADGTLTAADAVQIFGSRFATQMVGSIRSGKLDFEGFSRMLKESKLDVDAMGDSTMFFTQKLEMLKHGFEVALAPLGIAIIKVLTGFMPVVTQIIGGITRLVEAFTKLPQPIQNAFIIIAGLAAILGPLLVIFGLLISSFAAVVGGIISFGAAVLSIITGVVSFVASLVMLPVTLLAAVPALLAMVGGFLLLLPVIIVLSPLIIGMAAVIGGALVVAFGALVVVVATVVTALAALVAGLTLAWTQSATFRGILGTLAGDLVAFAGHVATAFGFFTKGEWKKGLAELKKGFEDLLNDLKKIDWHSVGKKIIEEIQKGVKDLMNTWGPIWDDIRKSFDNWVKSVNWQQLSKDIPNGIINGIKELEGLLGPVWDGIVTSFNNWMKSVPWDQLAKDIPNAIVNAIKLGMATIGPVWDFISKSFNDWKASVNWTQLAADIPAKIQQGIQSAQNTVGPVWDFIKTSLINWLNSVKWDDVGNQIGTAIKNAIKTALNTLVGGLGELIPTENTGSASLLETGFNAAKNFLTGFGNGVSDIWQVIIDGLEPLAGKVADYMENKVNWSAIGTFIGNVLGSMISGAMTALFGDIATGKTTGEGGTEGPAPGVMAAGGVGVTGASAFGTKQTGYEKLQTAAEEAGNAIVQGFVKGAQTAMANIDWGAIIQAAIGGAIKAALGPFGKNAGEPGAGGVPKTTGWGIQDYDWGKGLGDLGNMLGGGEFDKLMSGSWLKMPDMSKMLNLDEIGKSMFGWLPMKDGNLDLGLPNIGWPGGIDLSNMFGMQSPTGGMGAIDLQTPIQNWIKTLPTITWPPMPDFGAIFKGIIPPITWPAMPDIGSLLKGVIPPITWPAMPDIGSLLKGVIPPITWPAIPDIGSLLKGVIPPISWPAMPDFGAIFKGIIPPISWPAMPDFGSIFSGIIPPFSWPSLPSFSWPSIPSIDLGGWVSNLQWPSIPSIDLGGWVSNLQWPSIPSIDLGGWVANFQWPSVPGIDLGGWVANFVWPTVPSIDLGGWMSNFQWPSVPSIDLGSWVPSFSWPSIAGVDLASWIPAFPGWPALTGTGGLIGAGIQNAVNWAKAKAANIAKKAAEVAAPILNVLPGAEGIKADAEGEAFMTKGAQLRVIGEAGPEAVIPQKYWYAIPSWILDSLPKLGGGATIGSSSPFSSASSIEINITGNTISDERAARKLAKTIADTIKHERGII